MWEGAGQEEQAGGVFWRREWPVQVPRMEREGRQFENLVSSQNGLFGSGRGGKSCSHRNKLVVGPLGFDNFSVTVNCLIETVREISDAVSMLIYLFHLSLPLKTCYSFGI